MVQLLIGSVSVARQTDGWGFGHTIVDCTDEDGGKTEDGEWDENALHWVLDQPQGLARKDFKKDPVSKRDAEEKCGAVLQKSCNVKVEVFNRNSAMLRKKNTCSTCKRTFERLLTPERVT